MQTKNTSSQDQRRIPIGEYLKLKKYSLLLYVYLQQMSSWNEGEGHRYINMLDINKADISRKTGISKTALRNKFTTLESLGLIMYWDKVDKEGNTIETYILLPNIGDYYVLIDTKLKFMKAILKLCDEVLLRVFLVHKSFGKGGEPYVITLDYIAECIGYSKTNLDKIITANEVLEGLEVISQNKVTTRTKGITKSHIQYSFNKYAK